MPFTFTVKQKALRIQFEAGSVAEGASLLQTEGTALNAAFINAQAIADQLESGDAAPNTGVTGQATATEIAADTAKRKRRTRAEIAADEAKAAAATAPATAPAPLPVPSATAPPPPMPTAPPVAPDATIPPFLDRNATAPAATAIAPPPPPAPPPAPPAPPAGSPLRDAVIATLKEKKGNTDGAAYARWLSDSKVVVAGATFDEAIAVLQFFTEDQMKPLAKALDIG